MPTVFYSEMRPGEQFLARKFRFRPGKKLWTVVRKCHEHQGVLAKAEDGDEDHFFDAHCMWREPLMVTRLQTFPRHWLVALLLGWLIGKTYRKLAPYAYKPKYTAQEAGWED
jgi:hypothetical protein